MERQVEERHVIGLPELAKLADRMKNIANRTARPFSTFYASFSDL